MIDDRRTRVSISSYLVLRSACSPLNTTAGRDPGETLPRHLRGRHQAPHRSCAQRRGFAHAQPRGAPPPNPAERILSSSSREGWAHAKRNAARRVLRVQFAGQHFLCCGLAVCVVCCAAHAAVQQCTNSKATQQASSRVNCRSFSNSNSWRQQQSPAGQATMQYRQRAAVKSSKAHVWSVQGLYIYTVVVGLLYVAVCAKALAHTQHVGHIPFRPWRSGGSRSRP